jgi:hypothetical protein
MKARRATIKYGSINIEVFQLPNGEYRFSQYQVAKAVDKTEKTVRRFLGGKSPEVLEIKGSASDIELEKISIGGDTGGQFNAVPVNIALAFWTYQARLGNNVAQAILAAGTEETLLRRCDAAFNETKTEEEYQKQTAESLETNKMLFKIMEELQEIKALQQASRTHPGCRQVLDEEIENAFPQEMSFTAKEYLENKRLGLEHLRTLQKRTAQFIRLGIYGTPTEKKDGQLVYRGSQIIYLDMALKTILDL